MKTNIKDLSDEKLIELGASKYGDTIEYDGGDGDGRMEK